MVLIINDLSTKTHENTGNKPAKPEMNNKPNMSRNNHIHQKIYINLFGVDFIYGRQGCRFPTGEIKSLIFAPTMPSQSMEQ
jgi:hypothetical protein